MADRATHNGRAWSLTEEQPAEQCYPRIDTYQFQEFAGLVVELGGYSDLTAIDPSTGRRFWLGHAFTCDEHAVALQAAEPGDEAMKVYDAKRGCEQCHNSTFITAMRRLLDAMEALNPFGDVQVTAT